MSEEKEKRQILKNFVVLEGIDGAGTTTQMKAALERREKEASSGRKLPEFLWTSEPTTAPTGLFLRRMLKGEFESTGETSAHLFAADRSQHINGSLVMDEGNRLSTGVRQACNMGKLVISDRYYFSSLAYQSIDCGMDLPSRLNEDFPLPELLIFFQIDPEISLARVNSRGEEKEIYEKLDFQKKVALAYEKIMEDVQKENKINFLILDAGKKKEEISEIIWHEIEKLPIMKG